MEALRGVLGGRCGSIGIAGVDGWRLRGFGARSGAVVAPSVSRNDLLAIDVGIELFRWRNSGRKGLEGPYAAASTCTWSRLRSRTQRVAALSPPTMADRREARPPPKRSPREYFNGAVAAAVDRIITFPANKLMFRQQLEGLSIRMAFRGMQAEGWTTLYRGLAPPLAHAVVTKGLMFGLYADYKHWLETRTTLSPAVAGNIAAMMAGSTEAVLAPLERIQTLLQTPKYNKQYGHAIDVARSLRQYGFREYYRGIVPVVIRNGMSTMLYLSLKDPFFDAMTSVLPQTDRRTVTGFLISFVSGGLLGASLSTLFFPLNVAKSVMQRQVGGPHPALIPMMREIKAQRGGLAGMYRGVSVNMSRSMVTWGIITSVHDVLRDIEDAKAAGV